MTTKTKTIAYLGHTLPYALVAECKGDELLALALTKYGIDRVDPTTLIWPAMGTDDFDDLVESGSAGWDQPITVIREEDGTTTLIDGRNRLRASILNKVNVAIDYIDPPEDRFALTNRRNGYRNHLTAAQRAMVATESIGYYEEQARLRKAANGGDKKSEAAKSECVTMTQSGRKPLRSVDQAAAAAGVSATTMTRAVRIKKASPDLANKVLNGKASITEATKELKAREAKAKAPTTMAKAKASTTTAKPSVADKTIEQVAAMGLGKSRLGEIVEATGLTNKQVRDIARKNDLLLRNVPDTSTRSKTKTERMDASVGNLKASIQWDAADLVGANPRYADVWLKDVRQAQRALADLVVGLERLQKAGLGS